MGGKRALVERRGEVDALGSAVRRSVTEGAVLVIEGPAGIGKSRLVDAVRNQATGFDVLSARGGLLEVDIAFGVVRQLLEPRLMEASSEERAALLDGAASPAAQVLGFAPTDPTPPTSDLGRSLHGLFWLVANLAERGPLLLAVDDIHWADEPSLGFLVYLARRIEGLPILLVAAARDGETRAYEETIAELIAQATVLRPAPLSTSGVRELVEGAFGAEPSSELVEACRAATGGNPFYLGELLAAVAPETGDPSAISIDAVRATVPTTVARAILLRLGRLPAPAPRLAVAAALLGDGTPLRHAAALAGISLAEAEPAADALVRAAILGEVHPLRFEHPIVCAAIASDSPPAERAAMHRQAALLLEADREPLERIVPHLLHASPAGDDKVVEMLRRAACEATASGVPGLAVRYLRRALAEPPATDPGLLLAELSHAELTSGAYRESAATGRSAIDETTDPAMRARIRLHQAYALASVEGAPAALACLEHGIIEVSDTDPELALLLEAELVLQAWCLDLIHPLLARIGGHGHLSGATHAERSMLGILALDAVQRDQPGGVVRDLALRALAGGGLLTQEREHTWAYYAATCALLAAEANEDAREAIGSGMADCLARGSSFGFAGVCWVRGLLALAEGNLAAAEADERTCVEHAVPTLQGLGLASLALVLLEQGDVAAAHAELERGGLLTDDRPLYIWGPYVRGLVRLAQGRPAEALLDLQDVGRHVTEVGGFAAGLPWGAHLALALHALGDLAGARQAAAAELGRAQRIGGPGRLGTALRVSGLVGSGDEQLTHLTEAVAVLEPSPAKLELAKGQCDLGIALLRVGRRRGGREQLEKGYEGARACGARGLAQAAHDELIIAGARPRRLTFSGVESLTASERRVAEMAADGLTNREIAQAIFVTPKTVENQLGRAYSKLGLSSRRALRDALGRPSSEASQTQN